MGNHVWMWVTQDKYRLPLAVADTARELAEIVGTTTNNITSAVARPRHCSRYIRVDLGDDGDTDDIISTEREK